MFRNYEEMQMLLISSTTTDQWPQIDDHDPNLLMASTNLEQMVKAPQTQQQQQQHPQHQTVQKCPRCDSTNTKFCYYNNYSLSQPRHFCKACKRYWTRGGTLRNVPVGGGCRKNKRVKRPTAAATTTVDDHKYLSNPTTLSTKNPNSNAIINASPLITSMHSNLSSFHRFSEYNCTRVGSGNTLLQGFDADTFHPLGFSSGQLLMANDANTNSQTCLNNSCYGSLANNSGPLGTSSGFASLLESDNGSQQKFTSGSNLGSGHNFVEFARHDEDGMQQKVKMEQQMGLVDPNYSMFWSANGVGNYWLDPANIVSRIRIMANQSKFIGRMRGVEIGAIISAATLKDEDLLRAFEC